MALACPPFPPPHAQSHPHLMALACGDAFVRVYDRRKITLGECRGGACVWGEGGMLV